MPTIWRTNPAWNLLTALICGAIIGWIDLQASEVQPVVLLILIGTAVFGFIQPQRAWAPALIIGGSIFVAHVLAQFTGNQPPYEVKPNVFVTLLALIPGFIGAYIGAFISWTAQKQR